jgi:hypothetical protein
MSLTPQSTHVLEAKATLKTKPDNNNNNNNNSIRICASLVTYCEIKAVMEEQGEQVVAVTNVVVVNMHTHIANITQLCEMHTRY